jgi:RimJ/RimL family protein N-acetyltransferase
MDIRRLAPADALAYRALRLRGLQDHADAFTSSWEEESARPLAATEARLSPASDGRMWGAFAGEALIGAVGLRREERAKTRHKAIVFGMYVPAEHQGRGVGAALLAHLIDEARREDGLEQLELTVTEANARARALYERAGFRSFGIEPRAIRVGNTYHGKNHMQLFLTSP